MSEYNSDNLNPTGRPRGRVVSIDNSPPVKVEKKRRRGGARWFEDRMPEVNINPPKIKGEDLSAFFKKTSIWTIVSGLGYMGFKWFAETSSQLAQEQSAASEKEAGAFIVFEEEDFGRDYMVTYLSNISGWGVPMTDIDNNMVQEIAKVYGENWAFIPADFDEYMDRLRRPGDQALDPKNNDIYREVFKARREESRQFIESSLGISFDPLSNLYVGYSYDELAGNPRLIPDFLIKAKNNNPEGEITNESIEFYQNLNSDAIKRVPEEGSGVEIKIKEKMSKNDQQFLEVVEMITDLTGLDSGEIIGAREGLVAALDWVTDDSQLIELVTETIDVLNPFINTSIVNEMEANTSSMMLVGFFWLNLKQRSVKSRVKTLWFNDKVDEIYYGFKLGKYRKAVENLVVVGRGAWSQVKDKFKKNTNIRV